MDLFSQRRASDEPRGQPLAARMRPRVLEDIVGQEHLLGPGKLLRRAIEADRVSSLLLFGPPGTGKTSIAEVIAAGTRREFVRTSGVTANVAVLRRLFDDAGTRRRKEGRGTILFIDEIHRFSKSQQDVLLPHVEEGTVTLVGATTHNPMFFITAPLTSRSLLVQLTPLSVEAVRAMLDRAMRAPEGLGPLGVSADEDALNHLARLCDGDGRRALNALEIAALTTAPDAEGRRHIDLAAAQESIQKKAVVYDHDEDQHYDTISAFIKSVRGSDPHAAVYWLAKMLYAGEDPRFIVRRLVILAAEDIGNADPRALTLAMAAAHAVEFIGMPEAKLVLSQTTTYLATAPKSNSALRAIEGASADVEQGRTLAVPEHLKNVRIKTGADAAERSADYRYPHEFPKHFVPQEYVPTASRYYFPSGEGYEDIIRKRLARWDELREVAH